LLLGFSKLGTLMTFLVSLSVYWAIWGWEFALCFLLSIYVHEMGHVAALNSYGIPASAPMFIPGFGALVRLKQNPATAIEDSRVGLAGPIWGLGAALAAFAVYALTGNAFWGAVARAGAFINLFNLLPVWQLDGGRGLRSLQRIQVWLLVALTAALWYYTKEGLLLLIGGLMVFRAVTKRDEIAETDWVGFIQFAGLLTVLSLLCLIPIPSR
jgi:Zn-dependent protease